MQFPTIQKAIIKGFITSEAFVTVVMSYLKPEYFKTLLEKEIVTEAMSFYSQYKAMPSEAALIISVGKNLPSHENRQELAEYMFSLREIEVNSDWLLLKTEEFCRQQDFRLVVDQAILVSDGETDKITMEDIQGLLQNSLAISFKQSASHDYFRDVLKQSRWYKERAIKIPFNLEMFDKVTDGGIERKTLNSIMAGTGVGKSLFMCHLAANYLEQGFNVLYVTLELSEEKIRKRIDSNLLDIPMDNFSNLEEELYFIKVKKFQEKTTGRLKVQEFPSGIATTNHIRRLLQELQMKDGFKPDIICIDYLNLMNSSRVKFAQKHELIDDVAVEIRGLATEYDVGIWTGTQMNREGYKTNTGGNVGESNLSNTSQSMGIPNTSDFYIAATTDKYLDQAKHIKIQVLKSRYGDLNFNNKFVVGIDKSKMRIYDVGQPVEVEEEKKSKEPKDDKPQFDKSSFGKGMRGEARTNKFSDWNLDDDLI